MRIGQTARVEFVTNNFTTGAAQNADALPTATLFRNGVSTGMPAVTVSNLATGLYLASVAINPGDGWVDGDSYAIQATWTMNGTAGIKQVIAQGPIQVSNASADAASYFYDTLAELGAANTGLVGSVGYRIYNDDNVLVTGFTTASIIETSVPGNYWKTDGLTMSAGFRGRIEWGTAATKMKEYKIEPPTAITVVMAGGGIYTVTFTIQTTGGSPIVGASLIVKDSTETNVVAIGGLSNGSGQIIISLNTGTYKVFVSVPPQYIAIATQTLVVGTSNVAVTYATPVYTPTAPSDPALCRVYGFLKFVNGKVAASIPVTFKPLAAGPVQASGNIVAVAAEKEVVTDAGGYFETDLIRSNTLDPVSNVEAGTYIVDCPKAGIKSRYITVPDENTKELRLLL